MTPIILSGGSGTRLWPISRKNFPKQFSNILGKSLLLQTIENLQSLGSPVLLTNNNLKQLSENLINQFKLIIDIPFYEPLEKNTGPAILAMAKYLELNSRSDEIIGFFPSDHFIQDLDLFLNTLKYAEQYMATECNILCLGIKPTYPSTGYGYIEVQPRAINNKESIVASEVQSFHEKPSLDLAEKYLQSGNYLWNAGIFVSTPKKILNLFKIHCSELYLNFEKLKKDASNLSEIYESIQSISFDVGVMEKAKNIICLQSDILWSDLGTWDEMAKHMEATSYKNSNLQSLEEEAKNNFVYSDSNKLTAFVGVDDLIVVDTDDALLITKKKSSQKVKNIVEKLSVGSNSVVLDHQYENRPWGNFTNIKLDEKYKVKTLQILPGKRLSEQSHSYRAENWIVVKGVANVSIDSTNYTLKEGESIFVPQGAKHRIANESDSILEIVEVQIGSYFGEDDKIRYSDDYGRS